MSDEFSPVEEHRLLTELSDERRRTAKPVDASAFAEKVWARVDGIEQTAVNRISPLVRTSRTLWYVSSAAVFVVALGFVTFQAIRHIGFVSVDRTYATAAGQRRVLRLGDGTQMVLGPASRVIIPGDYAHGERTVMLEGEGYFTVRHDLQHPFAVRTIWGVTRDVGTVFAIRAYPEDNIEQVVVTEGEVSVEPRRRSAVALRNGDVADISNSDMTVQRVVDAQDYVSWVQGRLAFKKTPLSQVALELSRTFDLSITVADSTLAAQRITASFDHESVAQILEIVTEIVGGRYEKNGRAVTIRRAVIGMPSPSKAAEQVTVSTTRMD